MFCEKCGSKLEENAKFCNSCGTKVESVKSDEVQETKKTETVQPATTNTAKKPSNNVKLWKILAYIGPLFLIGLLCEDKNDKSVRFHVGQGMLVCIADAVISMIVNFGVYNIFRKEITVWGFGTGQYEVSPIGHVVSILLYAIPTVLMIIGIVNASKEEDKELPVIGQYAFYK